MLTAGCPEHVCSKTKRRNSPDRTGKAARGCPVKNRCQSFALQATRVPDWRPSVCSRQTVLAKALTCKSASSHLDTPIMELHHWHTATIVDAHDLSRTLSTIDRLDSENLCTSMAGAAKLACTVGFIHMALCSHTTKRMCVHAGDYVLPQNQVVPEAFDNCVHPRLVDRTPLI